MDPSRSGRGIFFSHAYDLTLTAQRIADADAAPASAGAPVGSPARADKRFWYNYNLAQPLADGGAYRCERVGYGFKNTAFGGLAGRPKSADVCPGRDVHGTMSRGQRQRHVKSGCPAGVASIAAGHLQQKKKRLQPCPSA